MIGRLVYLNLLLRGVSFMINKKLKRKIAAALFVAIATTMVTTVVPVEFGGMAAEAATAETIKITMKSEDVEITDEMRNGMYLCAGEDNVDSTLFKETNGKLIKLTLDLDTAESEMGAFGCSIGYDIKETIPIGFLQPNGNSYRTDTRYYEYGIQAAQVNNSRNDIEDESGRYVRVTGANANLIYGTGSIAIFYFWIPNTSIGKVDFKLYNYGFSGNNGEKIALEEGTFTIHSYDTGKEAATVTFDANGGFFGEETTITKVVAKDSKIKIENPIFDGRKFLGWSEDKKGESGIEEIVTAKDGVTYYAIWASPDLPSTGNTSGNTGGNTGGNGSSGTSGGSSSDGSVVTLPTNNKPSNEDQNTDPSKDKDTTNPSSDNTGKDNNTSSDNEQNNKKDNEENSNKKKPVKKKKVKLNKKKASVKVGRIIKLKVLNTKKKVTWSSNKPKIAKVSKKGKVTALKSGKAVIKAKVENGKTLKFKITIKKVSKNKK